MVPMCWGGVAGYIWYPWMCWGGVTSYGAHGVAGYGTHVLWWSSWLYGTHVLGWRSWLWSPCVGVE